MQVVVSLKLLVLPEHAAPLCDALRQTDRAAIPISGPTATVGNVITAALERYIDTPPKRS